MKMELEICGGMDQEPANSLLCALVILAKIKKNLESKKKSSRHNEAVETRSILVDTKWVKNIFEGAL